jgi:C4-dicarboxylate transporter DctQ subunit
MNSIRNWLSRGAEFIAAMALAAIFVTFLLQIVFRYTPFLEPIGWSVVLISLLWVWLIFFGCAFVVREPDHVKFDVLYLAAPPRVRRVLALLTAVLMIVALAYALPSIWDTVFNNRLMDMKKIQAIRMPVTGDRIANKWLFASIVMLMVVVTARYAWRIVTLIRRPMAEDETATSGVDPMGTSTR